jgi:hypothetical protein
LSSLSSAVEASNHYRKESKKLSSFLELRRGRHDTTNCITTVAGKITPPPLYSLLPLASLVLCFVYHRPRIRIMPATIPSQKYICGKIEI